MNEEAPKTMGAFPPAPNTPPKIELMTGGFPSATIPTVFADGVMNLAPSASVMKFYLYRTDPDEAGAASYKNQVFAQIVMPMAGFVQAAAFFERAVKHFTSQGTISQEMVDAIRKTEGL